VKVNEFVYSIGLILNDKKQTFTNIARAIGVSHDKIYRLTEKLSKIFPFFPNKMIELVNKIYKEGKGKGFLIIDDTLLTKAFCGFIEGAYHFFNSITGQNAKAICIVVIAWSNDKYTIPLTFKVLIHKDFSQGKYKTRTALARELILEVKDKVMFEYLLFDGHYSTKENITFLVKEKILFEAKIAKNRVITQNGKRNQICDHPKLKLKRNSRSTMINAKFGETSVFISAHKRKNRNGEFKIIYLISNMMLNAKQYLSLYEKRWGIEVMFRSLKQDLGIAQCQSRLLDKQILHIFSAFHAYPILIFSKQEFLKLMKDLI